MYTFHFSVFSMSGQAIDYRLEREPFSMPLSLETTSLGKYIQNPVDTYTKISDINMSLCTIELGDVSEMRDDLKSKN